MKRCICRLSQIIGLGISLALGLSSASAQSITFFGTAISVNNGYNQIASVGDSVTISIGPLKKGLFYDPNGDLYYPDFTADVAGYNVLQGLPTSNGYGTLAQLVVNDQGKYGFRSIHNYSYSVQLKLDMLTSKPILSSVNYFPPDIPISDFDIHSGMLFGWGPQGFGTLGFEITGYSGSLGTATIPEPSSAAVWLTAAALVVTFVARRRQSVQMLKRGQC